MMPRYMPVFAMAAATILSSYFSLRYYEPRRCLHLPPLAAACHAGYFVTVKWASSRLGRSLASHLLLPSHANAFSAFRRPRMLAIAPKYWPPPRSPAPGFAEMRAITDA